MLHTTLNVRTNGRGRICTLASFAPPGFDAAAPPTECRLADRVSFDDQYLMTPNWPFKSLRA